MKGRAEIYLFLLRACLPSLLLITSPAFFYACTERDEQDQYNILTEINIEETIKDAAAKASEGSRIFWLDIFVFNNDEAGALDSYERIDDFNRGQYCTASSTAGKKRVVIIANCPSEKLRFSELSCYSDLVELTYELNDEILERPVMSGEKNFLAGIDKSCTISIKSLVCEIVIDRIKSEREIEDVRVGLKNICTLATLIDDGNARPTGFEDEGQMSVYRAGLTLKCYPNTGEGGLGSPATELVVKWKERGIEKEYSHVINGDTGIERNACYHFSIVI